MLFVPLDFNWSDRKKITAFNFEVSLVKMVKRSVHAHLSLDVSSNAAVNKNTWKQARNQQSARCLNQAVSSALINASASTLIHLLKCTVGCISVKRCDNNVSIKQWDYVHSCAVIPSEGIARSLRFRGGSAEKRATSILSVYINTRTHTHTKNMPDYPTKITSRREAELMLLSEHNH